MIEVERKYRIQSIDQVVQNLKHLNYEELGTVQQEDRIYLKNSKSFTDGFKKSDPVMRIRTVDGVHKLTYKRSINDQGDSIEHEVTVSPVDTAIDLLRELGYKLVTNVSKKRTEYKLDNVTVVIDNVLKLGLFVEVEVLCNEGEEEKATRQVNDAVRQLGLNEIDIEHKKYDHLMAELEDN